MQNNQNQKNGSSKLNKKAEQELLPYDRYYKKIPFLNARTDITNSIAQENIVSNGKARLTKNERLKMSITPDEVIIERENKIKATIKRIIIPSTPSDENT